METIWTWCCDVLRNPQWFYLITTAAKLVLVFAVILAFVVLSVWIERRVAGWIQDRPGPNRAGLPLFLLRPFGSKEKQPLSKLLQFFGCPPDGIIARLCRWLRLDREIPTFGLMQPCLDGGKLFLKQEITPKYVRTIYFIMAPMLVLASLDFSGRTYFAYEAELAAERLGTMETETVREFFMGLASGAQMNLHIRQLAGQNTHHIVEAMFKAVAKSMDMASMIDGRIEGVLSTKGVL